jgi:hypothetical protein
MRGIILSPQAAKLFAASAIPGTHKREVSKVNAALKLTNDP